VYSPSNLAYRCTASTATTIGHIVASDWKSAVLEINLSVDHKEVGRTVQSEMRETWVRRKMASFEKGFAR
jgi:hypothetical protein